MTLGKKIKQARHFKRLTQRQLALATGVSQAAISKLECSNAKQSAYAVQLAKALDIDAEWLVQKEHANYETTEVKSPPLAKKNTDTHNNLLPLLTKEQVLNYIDYLKQGSNDLKFKSFTELNHNTVISPTLPAEYQSANNFAIKVFDQSMAPTLTANDIVFINPDVKPQPKQLVLVHLASEATINIRWLVKSNESNFAIKPEQNSFTSYQFNIDEFNHYIKGVVIATIRLFVTSNH